METKQPNTPVEKKQPTRRVKKGVLVGGVTVGVVVGIISIALAAVFALTVILGAVTIGVVNATGNVLSYHSVRVSDDMFNWWHAYMRRKYIVDLSRDGRTAADVATFWSLPAYDGSGRTHEEVCYDETLLFVERIAISADLFDTSGYELTKEDKETALSGLESILRVRFEGDKGAFNKAAKPYGFTYRAVEKAAILEHKRNLLISYSTSDDIQRDAYYNEAYVRVMMVYVEKDDPNYESKVAELAHAVTSDSTFLEIASDDIFNDISGAEDYPTGYYFAEEDDFTISYRELLPDVANAVFDLENVGDYTRIDARYGEETTERTYFIRRYELEKLAYLDDDKEDFFSDFTQHANTYYFGIWRDSYLHTDAKWKTHKLDPWVPSGSDSSLKLFFTIAS